MAVMACEISQMPTAAVGVRVPCRAIGPALTDHYQRIEAILAKAAKP